MIFGEYSEATLVVGACGCSKTLTTVQVIECGVGFAAVTVEAHEPEVT